MPHTPGPWTAKHIAGSNFAVQEFSIRGAFDETPHVYPIFNKDRSAIDGTTVFCSPEDARLIAAAPELLEALETIVSFSDFNDEESHRTFVSAVESARAVIGKATGR